MPSVTKKQIVACLREAGVTADQVDYIGFYEKPLVKFNRILETILACWPWTLRPWLKALPLWLGHRLHIGREIQNRLNIDKDILYCQHHLSHAGHTSSP